MSIKQVAYRNASGVATRFVKTPVVTIRSVSENRLNQMLSEFTPTGSFVSQPVVLVDEVLRQGSRVTQGQVVRAVLISPTLWATALGSNPGLMTSIVIVQTAVAELLLQDRMNRVLPSLSPHQDRITETVVVPTSGSYRTGHAFVDSTARCTPDTPISTVGSTASVTFNTSAAGSTENLTYVTIPQYTVVQIGRTAAQPTNSSLDPSAIGPQPMGYLMSPTLATLFGLDLPAIS